MKLFATSALALCLTLAIGCAEGNTTTPEAATLIANATNKVEANIEGMDCTGCSGSVVAAVEQIEGVKAASADVATGDVKVALEDDADGEAKLKEIEAVLASLSEGKYTVIEINAFTAHQGDPETGEAQETAPAEEPTEDEQASTQEQVSVFASYKVKGMDCSGCSSQIVKAVEQVDGVQKVEADHMTGAVKVSFDDRFDDKKKTDEIKDLIASLSNGKYTVSY